jgi:hexosaminidase
MQADKNRTNWFRRRHVLLAIAFGAAQLLAACSADLADGFDARSTAFFVPLPAQYAYGHGALAIADHTLVLFDPHDADAERAARYLSKLESRMHGPVFDVQPGDAANPPAGAIAFRRVSDAAIAKESYRLDVTPAGAVISAPSAAGLLYGGISFWELLPVVVNGRNTGIRLRTIHISDAPRFAWRGILLDSVRHYQSPEFIKSFIDAMALHKLNVLQWHLTDDQGWRLEIKKYPRLTSVGAWRVPAGEAAQKDIDPATGKSRLYGGFYTQDQVRDIVRYAADRNVTIVPEIEMPGHAEAAIVAYPQLGSVAHPPTGISSDWGVFPYLYNVDDSTFAFLDDVLSETMALFPGAYIHVGGDEAVKDQWKTSPKIHAQMKTLGIANEDALQSYFVARIGKFLAAHGRKLIGWDEILKGGVPPDATITSWRGVDGGIAAAKMGHDAVMSPAPVLYFDNRNGDGADEPPGRGHVTSLEDVYNFDPAPATLSDFERAHIIGVQANIWTEHIRLEQWIDHMAFPRAAALAEIAWSPAGSHNWQSFLMRLAPEMDRYRALGIDAASSAFEAHDEILLPPDGHNIRVTLTNQTGFGDFRYVLIEHGRPGSNKFLTAQPGDVVTIPLPGAMGVANYYEGRALSETSLFGFDPHVLQGRRSQRLKLCTERLPLWLEDDTPLEGPRERFLVDIMNPCWTYEKADLEGVASVTVAVGRVPFNFQLGQDVNKIVLRPPQTPDGELEVHLDTCDGERIAVLSLKPAIASDAVTKLSAPISLSGRHDLCFVFTQKKLDPLWVIDWINLVPGTAH